MARLSRSRVPDDVPATRPVRESGGAVAGLRPGAVKAAAASVSIFREWAHGGSSVDTDA
jgi:hypothetical protein